MRQLSSRVRLLASLVVLGGAGCSLLTSFPDCVEAIDCPADSMCVASECVPSAGPTVVEVQDDIRSDTEWTADAIYVLPREIVVEAGKTLTIRAGTTILGREGSALIVRRGGKLEARGNAKEPIVFTSERPTGERLAGDWGGVALLGSASVNEPGALLEGVTDASIAEYGGTDDASSCGVLEYVRIEFAGFPVLKDQELNGLTLAGCGSGTIVDHVQVHRGKDDGVEIFGGTVGLRHVLITAPQDDGLDWDRGWRGTAQFVAIVQDELGDNAIEADNWKATPDAEPRSSPVLYNVTAVSVGAGSQRGLMLKAGTAGAIYNLIVLGQSLEGLDVQGPEVVQNLMSRELSIQHGYFYKVGVGGQHFFPSVEDEAMLTPNDGRDDDESFDEDAYFRDPDLDIRLGVDPELVDPFNLDAPDLRPADLVRDAAIAPSPDFDEGAIHAGAFAPGVEPWTAGWTAFPRD